MNDDDLKKMFDHSAEQRPSAEAKQRAIAAAMHVFNGGAEHDERENISVPGQGSALRPRPTDIHTFSGKNKMKKTTRNWPLGTLAAASVLMFASFIALRSPNPFDVNSEGAGSDSPLVPEASDHSAALTDSERQTAKIHQKTPGGIAETKRGDEDVIAESESAILRTEPKSGHQQTFADASNTAGSPAETATNAADQALAAAPLQRFSAAKNSMMKSYPLAQRSLPVYRPEPIALPPPQKSRERFEKHSMNAVKLSVQEPVSTFSIDVDTASYSFARRKLNRGVLPARDAVRVEEFINYFDYDYPNEASPKEPFSTHILVGDSPWRAGNKLLHIGIKGYDINTQPASNIVFLLDVSGSMSSPDKLPLVKQSIGLLLETLRPDDSIAIVVYAGAAGTVLEPTAVKEKQKIMAAITELKAGGSTAGAAGIELAYQLAEQNFHQDAVNRIVLATDGDFNVGINDPSRLQEFVEKKRKKGIFLSVLGFGEGNYHDALMQALAQNGNGVAAYIDSLSEAQKVLVTEATSALFPIAKDVKIQVEFNPDTVAEYRLIGYETRQLKREDFNNDKVDAGDIGSGHTVTALYEITPVESDSGLIDDSRYAKKAVNKNTRGANMEEYALVKLRYKLPKQEQSTLITQVVPALNTLAINPNVSTWQQREFMFSAAVAGFAQLLKDDKYMGDWNYDTVIDVALANRGDDVFGYRNEFVQLVRKAKIAKAM